MKAGYSVASTLVQSGIAAKTILAVLGPAQFGVDLRKFRISFIGTSVSAVPVLVELCYLTAATNSTPGTGNTSRTAAIQQVYGRPIVTGFVAFENSTAEPTVLTVLDSWTLTPAGGLVVYDFPLDSSPDSAVSQGFAVRVTAGADVGTRATLWFERC